MSEGSKENSKSYHISTNSFRSYGTTEDGCEQKRNLDLFFNKAIGDFGRWQFKISILMSLLKFPIAWFQLGIVFLAPPTEFWCKPPDKYKYIPTEKWIDLITPPINDTKQHSTLETGSCVMKDLQGISTFEKYNIVPCQWGYDYNRSVIRSSIITEWDLVCGKERLVDVAQITLMFGVLLGSIIFGVAADKFGRRKILLISIFLQSICSILSSVSPWYSTFLLFRFFLALANGGTMTTSFVMCMEVVGGVWRTIVPILYQISFGFGNSIMAGTAYFLREWRQLQFALSVLSAVYISYYWLLPESPRWLLAVGRKDQAQQILEDAANTNGMESHRVKALMSELSICSEEHSLSDGNSGAFAILKTPKLRKRTILLCTNWLICGISFFSFSQYLGVISHNLYLAVVVGGLIAAPGTLLCVVIVKRCGRRISIMMANMFTAMCFLSILAIPKGHFKEDWPRIAFAGLGVVGMSVSLPALYLFTGELFPTVLRNAGLGCSVMCSKLGSMLAPLVISLGEIRWYLPLLLLGTLTIFEGILVLPLPETLNAVLPEKIEDIECTKRSKDEVYKLVPTTASRKS